jgi:hypothetical protein
MIHDIQELHNSIALLIVSTFPPLELTLIPLFMKAEQEKSSSQQCNARELMTWWWSNLPGDDISILGNLTDDVGDRSSLFFSPSEYNPQSGLLDLHEDVPH